MKRKINGRLLLFSVLILLLGIVLLGVMFRMEHGADSSFQAHLYSTKFGLYRDSLRNMGPEGYLGLLAFGLIAFGCYGILKGMQGSSSEKEALLQMPPVGCILLSAVLVFAGGAALYSNLVLGKHGISSSREAILAVLFIFLGGLVFYRGMQGKEYRYWKKDWQSLDAEKLENAEKGKLICPYCENTMTKKELYCPICGRKL